MMGTDLQQLLRNLCLNTEWNYVVFWKLKHHPRMVLAWEDAFYHKHAKHDPCGSRCHEGIQSLLEGSFSQDPLGLAVAKMAYHVYSLGEGIVGQVAVTGKHHWILADEHPANSLLSPEQCDGWQAQFLAGVQTLVVAAVLPHGVVQLGSMNKVTEDSKLIAHLRDVFSTFEESSASPVSNAMLHSLQMLMNMSDAPTNPVVLHGCPVNLCKGTDGENLSLPLQNQVESCHEVMLPAHQMQTVRLVTNNKPFPSISKDGGSASVVQSHFKQESKELTYEDSFERTSSYDAALLDNKPGAEGIHFPSHLLGSSIHDRYLPGYSSLSSQALLEADEQLQRNLGKSTVLDLESNSLGRLDSTSKLSSGYELHEALGPAFVKQNYPLWWDLKNSNPQATSALGEGMEHSMLTSETGTDHLLDAVVANFCSKEHQDLEGMNSLSASAANSLLTTEKTIHETSIDTTSHTVGSLCYSTDYSSLPENSSEHRMTTSSGSYSVKSSKAFSSPGTSMSKEQFLPPSELLKSNKKRAKPGENSRPRPRDRQLIQDRIKELRELVPNGSKCSIDSLLEHTIKHMLYLQSVTKHADKLGNCARPRANKDMGSSLGRSSCDQGASWAVEVGGHMKICPIVVENLNMNGQMLIEMLCEDCSYFLEIAEAIRGLGLIILKGETESHGDKTWMRFVVEGQNNRNMHRMDVLWSLVQILQTKAAT